MRLIGERWWLTTSLLYLPRFGFGLPLPVVTLALLLFGPRRLLWGLPLAIGLLLFPLMGLELAGGSGAASASPDGKQRPVLRLLSYNIANSRAPEELAAIIRAGRPDILLMQEYQDPVEQSLSPHLPGFH